MLISQAKIVNEGRTVEGDVLIKRGRIEKIAPFIAAPPRTKVIDARGKLLLPGVIDDQVHFREPGFPEKADMASESAAAVAGGTTSFMDMPNTNPQTVTYELLAAKYDAAHGRAFANHAFYFGATNDNVELVARLKKNQACGVKIFMGASTGNMLVDDPATLDQIFARCPLPITTHCESTPMIKANEAKAREKYGDAVPVTEHPIIRSAEVCYASSELAVGLAKKHGARLHVLHLTTARELALFERGPIEAKRITAEVCAHHLWFDESSYATLGTKIKCNPAIKTAADRDALRAAVVADRIDVIATDHAPHTLAEKGRSYFEAPSGLPLVQHSLLMLLDQHAQGLFTLPKIVEKAAHNPALLFGIAERGFIREGYYADLVAVDLAARTRVDAKQVLYKCGWSPFEGTEFRGRVALTVLNGAPVFRDGEHIAGPRRSRALEFRAR